MTALDPSRITWSRITRAVGGRTPRRVDASAHAAVALVLRDGPASLELLLILRAEHAGDPWSGHVAFPGGRVEPGDANLRETAIRETLEETGLDLRGADYLGALDEIPAIGRLLALNLAIAPFVFRVHGDVTLTPSDEVQHIRWVPIGDLLDAGCRGTLEYVHEGVAITFPCLKVSGLTVWGLTYRMFSDFAALVAAADDPGAALP